MYVSIQVDIRVRFNFVTFSLKIVTSIETKEIKIKNTQYKPRANGTLKSENRANLQKMIKEVT